MLVRCRVELAPWTYPHPSMEPSNFSTRSTGEVGWLLVVVGCWWLVIGGWLRKRNEALMWWPEPEGSVTQTSVRTAFTNHQPSTSRKDAFLHVDRPQHRPELWQS